MKLFKIALTVLLTASAVSANAADPTTSNKGADGVSPSGGKPAEVILRSRRFTPGDEINSDFANRIQHRALAVLSLEALSANEKPRKPGREASLPSKASSPQAEFLNLEWQHGVVVLPRPLDTDLEHKLDQAGVKLRDLVGGGYLASIKTETDLAQLRADGLLTWAGPLQPSDKVETRLRKKHYAPWAVRRGRIKVLIQFFPDTSEAVVRRILHSIDPNLKDLHIANTWSLIVPPNMIDWLAGLDVVRSIQQGPTPSYTLDEAVRRVAHVDDVQHADILSALPSRIDYQGLAGRSVKIGVVDVGIYGQHPDFSDQEGGKSRLLHPRFKSISSPPPPPHGTHVASIIAGSGANSESAHFKPFALRGIAPKAVIGDYKFFADDSDAFNLAIGIEGMDLTNHSYTQTFFGAYDQTAVVIDREIRGGLGIAGNPKRIESRPQVWAAGNNGKTSVPEEHRAGYYSVFTSAKNSISVGSIDVSTGQISTFSSMGPTDDGRVKPDLVAPGCMDSRKSQWTGIEAAEPTQAGYGALCGTSQAAPVVSGTIALMIEKLRTVKPGATLSSATAKALLVETAQQPIPPDGKGPNNPSTGRPVTFIGTPNFTTGFGVVDARAAVDLAGQVSHWTDDKVVAETGVEFCWAFDVPAGSDLVKATLAWDDVEGSLHDDDETRATPALVNDLDLHLVTPSGRSVLPWVATPPVVIKDAGGHYAIDLQSIKAPTRGEDHLNNVEMVSLSRPDEDVEAGRWSLIVRGAAVAKLNQKFSVAANFPLIGCGQ